MFWLATGEAAPRPDFSSFGVDRNSPWAPAAPGAASAMSLSKQLSRTSGSLYAFYMRQDTHKLT